MNAKEFILAEYRDLYEGESRAGELCPSCKGGRSGERTLSISNREGVLLWTCHRDSCSFTGSTGGAPRTGRPVTQAESCRGMVGRLLAREAERIPQEISDVLLAKYAITQSHCGRWQLGWLESEQRLSIPVLSPDGETCGVNLRSFNGATPKAKLHSEENSMAWYMKRGSHKLVIVEDQFSAIRASDYCSAVALLGTNINDERARQIRKQTPGYERFLALDKDAFSKAVSLTVRYRGLLGLRLLTLDKDLKDLTDEELASFMSANVNT